MTITIAPPHPRPTTRPLLCGSVPSGVPGDGAWGEEGAAAPDYDTDDDDDDDDVDGERVSRGAWGDDASVSSDPAAIEAAWGHAVDFVVDAGLLEVHGVQSGAPSMVLVCVERLHLPHYSGHSVC